KALAITPVNPAHPFELPPSGDTVIDFVNELGYPEPIEIVSSKWTNSVLPGPESVKNQESEKSPKEIIKAKKEKDEEKQDSTYSLQK
ncbi:hypothetical protein Tco_1408923, partial [Tanacetum coccineum]